MSQAPTNPLDEGLLVDSVGFFRRMGNYLFFPLFIVFGCCSAFMLLANDGPWRLLLKSSFFLVNATLATVGMALWRLSRRPRPMMLFAVGITLGIIEIIWAVWLLYLITSGGWKMVLFRGEYALVVLIGVGSASLKCFRLWSALRNVDEADLEVALRQVDQRSSASH